MTHNSEAVLTILSWEKPSDGWLKITVREPLLGMTEAYYWCEQPDGKPTGWGGSERVWAWRQWSMAGKPTVKVNPARSAILSNLTLEHDVLRHVGEDLGIEQADPSERTDP